jgi:hypothetical protein
MHAAWTQHQPPRHTLATDAPVFAGRAAGAPAFGFRASRTGEGNAKQLFRSNVAESYWVAPQQQQQALITSPPSPPEDEQHFIMLAVNRAAAARTETVASSLARPGVSDGGDLAIPDSPVARAFFSTQNEETLQSGLQSGVLALCNQPGHSGPMLEISRHDPNALRARMRGVFLERFGDALPRGVGRDDVAAQVAVFNAWVWREMVPDLYSAARQQYHYLTHFRRPIPVAALTRQTDRDFRDDIDGRKRLQFSNSIAATSGAAAAVAGQTQFLLTERKAFEQHLAVDKGGVNAAAATNSGASGAGGVVVVTGPVVVGQRA